MSSDDTKMHLGALPAQKHSGADSTKGWGGGYFGIPKEQQGRALASTSEALTAGETHGR